MSSLNRPARLNRGLLVLFGLILLAAGACAIAAHYGAIGALPADRTLVPGTATPPTWALYTTAVAAVIAGLLALRWLLAQLASSPKTRTWRLERDPADGATTLASVTAVEPFTNDISAYPGVHTASATLTGPRDAPALAVIISTEQHTDLTTLRQRLDTAALPRLRQALDLDSLPVSVEFRFTTKTGARAQ